MRHGYVPAHAGTNGTESVLRQKRAIVAHFSYHMGKKLLLGNKQGMTQVFTDDGRAHPATVIATGPLVVTQIKTPETDGYSALQIGYKEQKEQRLSKPLRGHMQKSGQFSQHLKEVRQKEIDPEVAVGDTLTATDLLAEGDVVDVSAVSKGKGFQGVVKRHGFGGGPRTHGQKHGERSPGSIGAQGPQRVLKGKKMAGHMGHERVTVKNLKILKVDPEQNLLYVRGAIPGPNGGLVEICKRKERK